MVPRLEGAGIVTAGVTIVTGASGGIGRATIETLTTRGHRCVGWDRVPAPAPDTRSVLMDLTDPEQVRQAIRESVDAAGVRAIVHCAGVVHFSGLAGTDPEVWQRVIQINLVATIGMFQQLIPVMNDGGRVVMFGSGTVPKGPAEMFGYTASKAGVMGFARSLARELGPRSITVNVVSPGFTETGMVQGFRHTEDANVRSRAIQRSARPEDVVGPVAFFLSEDAAFVTGQNLYVDGGSVMP